MSSHLSPSGQANTAQIWSGILNANGRFNRTEYAFWSIPSLLINLILFGLTWYVPDSVWGMLMSSLLYWGIMLSGALFLSATIRRLHDVNFSGWQVLLVMLLGVLGVLYLLVKPGKEAGNRWAQSL